MHAGYDPTVSASSKGVIGQGCSRGIEVIEGDKLTVTVGMLEKVTCPTSMRNAKC
jgi:hypothetical protein